MRPDHPNLYGFLPYYDRPRITWPDGAYVAFWVVPNIEFYELDPPINPARRYWQRPTPDVLNYGLRDYGNRVGIWRMMEVMDQYRIRGSVSLNVAVCDHFPEIIRACCERNWEFLSHGVYNTRFTVNMNEDQERAIIEDVKNSIRRHCHQNVAGWLAPATTPTPNTMNLLADAGIKYTLDLFHDDQPLPVNVKRGRLISLPYSVQVNDFFATLQGRQSPREYLRSIKAQFDRLYHEGIKNGQTMCLPIHPYLIGAPHRIGHFAQALDYITSHPKVWITTGREIADYYYKLYYDRFFTAMSQREQ